MQRAYAAEAGSAPVLAAALGVAPDDGLGSTLGDAVPGGKAARANANAAYAVLVRTWGGQPARFVPRERLVRTRWRTVSHDALATLVNDLARASVSQT